MRQANLGAIEHLPWLEYRYAMPDGRVCLRLRTGKDDFDSVSVRICCHYRGINAFETAEEWPMERAFQDELFDYYEVVRLPADPRMKYLFVLTSEEMTIKLDATGLHMGRDAQEDISEAFAFAYAYPSEPIPAWAQGCVGYQIFPDRFRREGPTKTDLEPWGSDRVQSEYRFGGNLRGIRAAVPYLKELGVDVVYTCPIFLSDSAHRYNTFDYYQIDPLLGTEQDLRDLCDTLHENGMFLVLDGVFNHSGTGFAPFVDAQSKGTDSPYRDWFFFSDQYECGYQTFSYEPYMPKLNLKNESCADYFLQVGKYWIEKCGIDGWRLDVSPEVWPDFWRQYRKMVKSANFNAIMVAECWDDSREWLTPRDMFDSTMHYVLSRNIWKRFAEHSVSLATFDNRVNRSMAMYPYPIQDALWNFLGSHDTQRFRTRARGDERMLRAASFFQMTQPGVPIIYYGDELGMEGGDDPGCRGAMHWDWVEGNAIRAHYMRLTKLRHESDALRHGILRTQAVLSNGLYAYLRLTDGPCALVLLNTACEQVHGFINLPKELMGSMALADAYQTDRMFPVCGQQAEVTLEAGDGAIIFYQANGYVAQ